jgi:hypothetical protein
MGFNAPARGIVRGALGNGSIQKILWSQQRGWLDEEMLEDTIDRQQFRTGNPYLVGGDTISRLFHYEVGRHQYSTIYREQWSSDKIKKFPIVDFLDDTKDLLTTASPSSWARLFEFRGMLVLFQAWFGKVSLNIGTNHPNETDKIIEIFKALFPATTALKDDECAFFFWHKSSYGSTSTKKVLKVVKWDEISPNYINPANEKLGHLMNMSPLPEESARLLLWYGLPGGGKTFSIRALARQWKEWCQFEYIIDPEVMLDNASYMTDVIHGDYSNDDAPEDEDVPMGHMDRSQKWRAVVMEDTGEVLSVDARQRSGQGLSRLLNLADGILGQGTRIIFLITTNEELGKLHPAVRRPGRCLSKIEFRPFNQTQAVEWLKNHGKHLPPELHNQDAISLAELYAVLNGQEFESTATNKVGFLN